MLVELLRGIQNQFSGSYAVYAEHLGRGEIIAFGEVERPFETASVMKVPVLVEALRQCENGIHCLDEPITYLPEDFVKGSGVLQHLTAGISLPFRDVLTLMIIVSDNLATNMAIRTVGLDAVNQLCRDAGLSSTQVRRKIAFDSPDPLALSSPRDLVELLKAIHRQTLLSPEYSAIALDIMERQQYNTILTRALPYELLDDNGDDPPRVRVMSKSGSLTGVRNDAGLVATPWGTYAIAIMSEGSTDPRFHVDTEAQVVLPAVSRAVFDHFVGDAWARETDA
ncbi:serine hydrolase [Sulfobacillus harzensis]|uniref:serine hydrolase n=1 Tax=Sulfobacillus harzensis TaxID=2729629 RepID=UPI00308418CC